MMEWSEQGLARIQGLVASGCTPEGTSVLKTKKVQRGYTFQGVLNSHLNDVVTLYSHHRRAVWNWGISQLRRNYELHQNEEQRWAEAFHIWDGEGIPDELYQPLMEDILFEREVCLEHALAKQEERKPTLYRAESWGNFNRLSRELTEAKNGRLSWLGETLSSVHTQALKDLEKSLKAYFSQFKGHSKTIRRGFPQFKSRHENERTFRFQLDSRCVENYVDLKNKGIRLPGFSSSPSGKQLKKQLKKATDQTKAQFEQVDWIRLRGGRFPTAAPKLVTVRLKKNRKVEISFMVEEEIAVFQQTGAVIGLDLGIKQFVTYANEEVYHAVDVLEKMKRKLANAQRRLARRTKGSSGWEHARVKVAEIQGNIAHARKDFQHKVSTRLIKNYSFIGLEDLNVRGMIQNPKLSKAIQQKGWSQFVEMLVYKGAWHGRWIQKVGRFFPSTQLCAACHMRHNMPLDKRVMDCTCGHRQNRDANAARNIQNESLHLFETVMLELEKVQQSQFWDGTSQR